MKDDRIQRAFLEFHRANPKVYEALVALARGYQRQGKKAGIKHLWEVARWQLIAETKGEEFKLNNNYTSRYARLIMRTEFDLQDFFEVRELQGEEEEMGQMGLEI